MGEAGEAKLSSPHQVNLYYYQQRLLVWHSELPTTSPLFI